MRPTLSGPSVRQQDIATREVLLHGYHPQPGDNVLELGAGTGEQTRLLAELVAPNGRVISVEAHPTTAHCLERTIGLNRLTNVTAVNAAMTASKSIVHIQDLPNYISNEITTESDNTIPVSGEPLGKLIDRFDLDRIDLLSMNIEGMEYDVLASAREVLGRVRNLIVSCHDFKADREGGDWQRTYNDVRSLLEADGYEIWPRRADYRPWIPYYIYASRKLLGDAA